MTEYIIVPAGDYYHIYSVVTKNGTSYKNWVMSVNDEETAKVMVERLKKL